MGAVSALAFGTWRGSQGGRFSGRWAELDSNPLDVADGDGGLGSDCIALRWRCGVGISRGRAEFDSNPLNLADAGIELR